MSDTQHEACEDSLGDLERLVAVRRNITPSRFLATDEVIVVTVRNAEHAFDLRAQTPIDDCMIIKYLDRLTQVRVVIACYLNTKYGPPGHTCVDGFLAKLAESLKETVTSKTAMNIDAINVLERLVDIQTKLPSKTRLRDSIDMVIEVLIALAMKKATHILSTDKDDDIKKQKAPASTENEAANTEFSSEEHHTVVDSFEQKLAMVEGRSTACQAQHRGLEEQVLELKSEVSRLRMNAYNAIAALKAYVDVADPSGPSIPATGLESATNTAYQDANTSASDEDAAPNTARDAVTQASNGVGDKGFPGLPSTLVSTSPGLVYPSPNAASSSFAGLTPSTAAGYGALSDESPMQYGDYSIQYDDNQEDEEEEEWPSDSDLDEYQEYEKEIKAETKTKGNGMTFLQQTKAKVIGDAKAKAIGNAPKINNYPVNKSTQGGGPPSEFIDPTMTTTTTNAVPMAPEASDRVPTTSQPSLSGPGPHNLKYYGMSGYGPLSAGNNRVYKGNTGVYAEGSGYGAHTPTFAQTIPELPPYPLATPPLDPSSVDNSYAAYQPNYTQGALISGAPLHASRQGYSGYLGHAGRGGLPGRGGFGRGGYGSTGGYGN